MYKLLVRSLLFRFDAECVHCFVSLLIRTIHRIPGISGFIRGCYQFSDSRLRRTVFGIDFPNPVGLAAGFDKDAKSFRALVNFGFGFIEIGTLTPKPQGGNPKRRLFRLRKDEALINRMGFNNGGVLAAIKRLKKNKNIIIGGNIGKNKTTPNDEAVNDYLYCFNVLFDWVNYFVINVSSPNTPGLRSLQEKEPLEYLLKSLQKHNLQRKHPKPILIKIAPDLSDSQLLDIIDIVKTTQIAGVIATNTTLAREGLVSPLSIEKGGLSGKPLSERSTEVIRFLHQNSNGAFPIIGVGGIHAVKDAQDKFEAGASLIQLYTGFIYEGPRLIKAINKGLISV